MLIRSLAITTTLLGFLVNPSLMSAPSLACLQETTMHGEDTLSSLCFTGDAAEIREACENIAHADEFMTVTTDIIETCPTDALGTCTFSIEGKEQISRYYDLSDNEKEMMPSSCQMIGGTWSSH